MKKSALAIIAIATFGLTRAANALLLPNTNTTIADLGPVKGGTTAAPTTLTGYEAYLVTLVAPSGVINGFDFTSNVAGGGIFGSMVQRVTASGADGGYDTTVVFSSAKNSSNSVTNVDSHFLFTSAADPNIVGAISAGETYGGSAAPVDGATSASGLPANTDSNGFYLSGPNGSMTDASGLAAGVQASTLPAIYLVIPNAGGSVSGVGAISTSTGTYPVTFGFPFPEPTAMSILCLGGLSLLARNRTMA